MATPPQDSTLNALLGNRLSKNQTKNIRALQRKKNRREQGLFLVEGEKVVAELLASAWRVQTLCASAEFINTYAHLIKRAQVPVVECSAKELASLGTLVSNNAALAVVHCATEAAAENTDARSWTLALDNINDPGNLGSLLRIADWYGIAQVVCSPTTVELYNPKVITASKGSFLRVPVSSEPLKVFLSRLPANTEVLGAYLDGESLHQMPTGSAGGVILLGSEASGISDALATYVTRSVTIPSFGAAESLNVAVAAAVICDNLRRLES